MRILVVDDDFLTRSQLKALLSRYGDCDAVPNGELAYEMVVAAHKEECPYSLVTMDIGMPDVDGREVVELIRRWEFEHEIPRKGKETVILMVSCKTSGEEVFSSFRKGCEGFITKPATPEKIEEALIEHGLLKPVG